MGHQANRTSTGPREGCCATGRSQACHETLAEKARQSVPCVLLLLMLDRIFPCVLLQGWIFIRLTATLSSTSTPSDFKGAERKVRWAFAASPLFVQEGGWSCSSCGHQHQEQSQLPGAIQGARGFLLPVFWHRKPSSMTLAQDTTWMLNKAWKVCVCACYGISIQPLSSGSANTYRARAMWYPFPCEHRKQVLLYVILLICL